MRFPKDFLFGLANADHQVEAHDPAYEDVWDLWERTQNKTQRGKACDFWNLYPEDIKRAADLGCKVFRFSIAWARVQTDANTWNQDAWDHYRKLAQCIKDHDMKVMVTLVHFVWPVWLEKEGGLIAPHFPERFTAYGKKAAEELGDLADYWITFNEPTQLVYGFIKPWWQSHYYMPPGLPVGTGPTGEAQAIGKLLPNLFLAHARARVAIKEATPSHDAQVGINPLVTGFPNWLQNLFDNQFRSERLFEATYRFSIARPLITKNRTKLDLVIGGLIPEKNPTLHFSQPYYVGEGIDIKEDNHYIGVPAHHIALLHIVNKVIADFNQSHDPELDDESETASEMPVSLADYFASQEAGTTQKTRSGEGLRRIKSRGVIFIGIRADAPGMCPGEDVCKDAGLEVELGRRIGKAIFNDPDKVRFVPLDEKARPKALKTKTSTLNKLWRFFGATALIANSNWWYLGSKGKLPESLCPKEAHGAHDFIGFDYYWGLPTSKLHKFSNLVDAGEGRFVDAPVWPEGLAQTMRRYHKWFPDQELMIIENGCVPIADRVRRTDYLKAHLNQVSKVIKEGVPVAAYLCWSLTSNREWGHPFTKQTDFGLYHVDLDNDPDLKRIPSPEVDFYKKVISQNKAKS